MLTLILSLNRLTQLCFPRVDEILFSKRNLKFWIGISGAFFIVFCAALASPLGTIRYYPEAWSWAYDPDYFGSLYVQKVEMVIELGGIPISGIIYLIVFGVLIAKVSSDGYRIRGCRGAVPLGEGTLDQLFGENPKTAVRH